MTYQTTEKQQTQHAIDFKKVAQAYGSIIMSLTVKVNQSGIDINDPKAAIEFAKIMKLCVKETQPYYKA